MKHILLLLFTIITIGAGAQYSTVNQWIPDDGSTVTFDMVVSGLPNTIDTNFGLEQICFNMTHTWDDDIEVKLKSPDGRIVFLFSHVGGDGDNFAATCLRADADTAISAASAPFTGYYRPMGDLGLFNNGQNPNGIWTFIVHDTYAYADQGYLYGWGLAFGNNPARSFPFFSSNLPIVKINTHGEVVPNEPKIAADFSITDNGPGIRNNVSDTAYAFKGKIMTELQGYSGTYYPKKNYGFYTCNSDTSKLDTALLGMPKEHDWILKSEYTDPTLLANSLTYEMCRRMGNYASRTRFCELLLNDEYEGIYTLTEEVKRGSNRVNIAKLNPQDTTGIELTGGYIIEMNINGDPPAWTSQYLPINHATNNYNVEFKDVYPKQDSIPPLQQNYIKTIVDSFENSLMRDSADPVTWRTLASEKSFIDFQIVDEFSVNYDSYGRSTYMYKEKATDGNKLHIGPSWDYDRAYPVGNTQGWVWEITHQGWPFPFWWSKFNSDSVYLKKLWCRWTELRMNTLSNDSFFAYIDSAHALVQEAASRNFARWPELGVTDYNATLNAMKDFVSTRMNWMDINILPHGEYLPLVNLNDTAVCTGTIMAQNSGNQFHYAWNNGDTLPHITVTQTGIYAVTVKDDYGCSASDNATISILPAPDASFSKTPVSGYIYSFVPADTNYVSYFWQFGNGFSSNLKTPSYTYSGLGNYVVSLTVTDANGCSSTSLDTVSLISGIAENNLEGVKVFPNPFNDFFEIEIPDLRDVATIKLNDVTGRVLTEMKIGSVRTKVLTANLAAGIYFIELRLADKEVQVFKLSKQ